MAGRPPTPMPFATTPLSPHSSAAMLEPTMPQSIGKRYFMLMPYMAGSVTPRYAEIAAGTEISRSLCLRLVMIMPTTAEPWAMFDSAISGHTGVPPMLWIICISTASVV